MDGVVAVCVGLAVAVVVSVGGEALVNVLLYGVAFDFADGGGGARTGTAELRESLP